MFGWPRSILDAGGCFESSPPAFGSYEGAILLGKRGRGNGGRKSEECRSGVCRLVHELPSALVGIDGGESSGKLVQRAAEERNVVRVSQVEGQRCFSGQILQVLGELFAAGAAALAVL